MPEPFAVQRKDEGQRIGTALRVLLVLRAKRRALGLLAQINAAVQSPVIPQRHVWRGFGCGVSEQRKAPLASSLMSLRGRGIRPGVLERLFLAPALRRAQPSVWMRRAGLPALSRSAMVPWRALSRAVRQANASFQWPAGAS